jgi:hypothetical protein
MSTGTIYPAYADPRTYRDLIDVLIYKLGAATDERNQAQIRSAIRNAMIDLVKKRNWNFFWRQSRIVFNAPFSDGTVQYTQSNRQIVLTPNTSTGWPSWVNQYARIRIGRVNSQVSSVIDSTTLQLDPVLNFGYDQPAGTAYQLYQNLFPLPGDFRAMGRPRAESWWWSNSYISPEDWMSLERAFGGTTSGGIPTHWTIFGDPNVINGSMIGIWPWPSLQQTYDYVYQIKARNLVYTGLSPQCQAGTIAGTAGESTITGTGTSWVAAQAGSIIRVGDTTTVPTGIEGLNPYSEQHVIQSVDMGAQTITIADTLASNLSGNKYIISDPINLPDRMITALLRLAELELADLKDRGKYDEQYARWQHAYFSAGEADQTMLSPQFSSVTAIPVRPAIRYMPLVGDLAGT